MLPAAGADSAGLVVSMAVPDTYSEVTEPQWQHFEGHPFTKTHVASTLQKTLRPTMTLNPMSALQRLLHRQHGYQLRGRSYYHWATAHFMQDEEVLPLDQAVGRTVKQDITSPISTPTFDSAAIDGYAVLSSQASKATPQQPIMLRCMGVIRPGQQPFEVDDRIIDNHITCVEISVGSPFPIARSGRRPYDALIPRDHATVMEEGGGGRILQITRPPLTSWHKRIAGSDFRKGDVILQKGTSVAPKHIMALASVGVRQIPLTRLVKVGVITVGSEIVSTMVSQQSLNYKVPDANGPFLAAALREMGERADYLGALPDSADVLVSVIRDKLQAEEPYDAFVITGGVAMGGSATVATCLRRLNAKVHFQDVAMQPGSSALFAAFPESNTPQSTASSSSQADSADTAMSGTPDFSTTSSKSRSPSGQGARAPMLFGLPGSPIAAACCFRFLVTPYIRALIGMAAEREIMAKAAVTPDTAQYRHDRDVSTKNEMIVQGSAHYDIFRHAVLRSQHDGVSVEVSKERSASKASPFASSNSWLHIPRGHVGVGPGDVANIYPFCSPKS
jgi:molybdopterin molybdotransferase